MGKKLTEDQLRRLAELRKKVDDDQRETEAFLQRIEKSAREEERYLNVLHNAGEIFDRLEESFEQRTGLTETDSALLFLATALQLFRIYALPKLKDKFQDSERKENDDPSIKKEEKAKMKAFFEKHANKDDEKKYWEPKESKKYRTWNEIVRTTKVPYDAIRHAGDRPLDANVSPDSQFFGRNMHGGQHRVKTLGHDPLLGWVFGVANIMTDTISICPEFKLKEKIYPLPYVETYEVDMGSRFCWEEQIGTWEMFEEAKESFDEDKHRLYAAVFAQGLHLESDKYTRLGLPVPILTLLSPDKAYDIYSSGYDYMDFIFDTQLAKRFLKSGTDAMFFNRLIAWIHQLFYDPTKEPDRDLYTVRTKRIVLYSNLIATGSDVIQAAIRADAGDEKALKDLDWGGLVVTMFHLIYDTAFIMTVKEEFVFKEWERVIESEDNILNC